VKTCWNFNKHTHTHTHACDNSFLSAFSVANAYRFCARSHCLKPGATKLLKLAMSGQFILASVPIRHIDASLKVIGGRFYVDRRTGGRTEEYNARDIACEGTRQPHENKVERRAIKPCRPNAKRPWRCAVDDEADSTSIAERSNHMRLHSHEFTPVSRSPIVCNVHTRLRSHRTASRRANVAPHVSRIPR